MWLFFVTCVLLFQRGVFAGVTSGPDVCFPTGQTSRLLCADSETDDHIFDWVKGSSVLDGDTVIRLTAVGTIVNYDGFTRHSLEDGTTLVISPSYVNDTDTYWCSISAGVPSDSDSLNLTVIDIPTEASLQLESPATESTEGNTVVTNMTCETPNYQSTTGYEWKKDDELISDSTVNVTFYESGKVLSLTFVTRKSAGKYTCIVKNCAGEIESEKEEFLVEHKPEILGLSSDASGLTFKGQALTLTADVESYPVPDISWSNIEGHLTLTDSVINVKADVNFKSVNCTVCNKVGCSSQVIPVSILNITLAGFVVTIVILVIVICAIIIVIVVVHKKQLCNRGQHTECKNEDRSPDTGHKPVEKNSDNPVELKDHS